MAMADNQQPLLKDGEVESASRRRAPVGAKIVGALLGSVGLFGLAATQSEVQVPSATGFLGLAGGLPTCAKTKRSCAEMVVASGPVDSETRSLPPFEHLVVGDIVSVTAFKVVPGAENSITFTANENLLNGTLEAAVGADGILTVGTGCACEPLLLDPLNPTKITATIVSSQWPQSLRFHGSSSGHFADLSGVASVSSEDGASLYINGVSGLAPAIGCKGGSDLEINSVHASGEAAFTALGACNLTVATGSSNSSTVKVSGGKSKLDLGAFATQQTVISAYGAGSFTGQTASTGVVKSVGAASVTTTLRDSGDATCIGVASVAVATAGLVVPHYKGFCTVAVTPLQA